MVLENAMANVHVHTHMLEQKNICQRRQGFGNLNVPLMEHLSA